MQVVLFAGGLGTRISEESHLIPKPMIEIGSYPILWHIMKTFAHYGHREFIICAGYKSYVIREYFLNYFYRHADLTIDLNSNQVEVHERHAEPFKITVVETGLHTSTSGRLKRIKPYIRTDQPFMLTYGDGLIDVDLGQLVDFHNQHKKIATVTSVQPMSRFGLMDVNETGNVTQFIEKPKHEGAWINAGYFVLNYGVFDYLKENADEIMWEKQPMEDLANKNELMAFRHYGFFKPMDTLRDKNELEVLWSSNPPWKVWS